MRPGDGTGCAVVEEGRFFAIAVWKGGFFVDRGDQGVSFGFGVAVVVDEAHAGCEWVLGDRWACYGIVIEAPGEGEDAEEED